MGATRAVVTWLKLLWLEVPSALVGRHWLFVAVFSPRVVEEFLRRRIEQIEGPTWSKVAQKVGRLGLWEFEDYRPWTG